MHVISFFESDSGRFIQVVEELGTAFPEPNRIVISELRLEKSTFNAQDVYRYLNSSYPHFD